MKKTALITGITGQDGAYLTEYLLKKGYIIHGIKRRSSLFNTDRIDHLYQDPHIENRNMILHYGDLTDSMNLTKIIQETQPDEIYNLGAMSHVRVSFDIPEYVANTDGMGTLRILEAVRLLGLVEKTRIYQASSSELYGMVQDVPQSEKTPFYPRSPYGVAKLFAYWITKNYREAYKIHASNGILFNHESPIRGETFVTRKVTRAVSRIVMDMQDTLYIGNLSAKRDWGHAKDYIKAMYLILQQDEPDDYVIATGITTSIRDFIKMAFAETGIEVEFKGEGVEEEGRIVSIDEAVFCEKVGEEYLEGVRLRAQGSGLRARGMEHGAQSAGYRTQDSGKEPHSAQRIAQTVVRVDPQYFRPTEVDLLIGDPTKAKEQLGWEPEYDLAGLVKDMMGSDIKLMKKERYLKDGGYETMNYYE